MVSNGAHPNDDRDWNRTRHLDDETLSTYLDERLAPAVRASVADHLAHCAACRRNLDELRTVTALLADLPEPTLPRSFALTPGMVAARQPRIIQWLPRLRVVAAIAAMLLVVSFAPDLLVRAGLVRPGDITIRAPGAESQPAAAPARATLAPAAKPADVASQQAAPEAAEPAAVATKPAAAEAPRAAAPTPAAGSQAAPTPAATPAPGPTTTAPAATPAPAAAAARAPAAEAAPTATAAVAPTSAPADSAKAGGAAAPTAAPPAAEATAAPFQASRTAEASPEPAPPAGDNARLTANAEAARDSDAESALPVGWRVFQVILGGVAVLLLLTIALAPRLARR